MIVTLAGRRIDLANAEEARFPLTNVNHVRKKITDFLKSHNANVLVGSGACGADLVAMEAAKENGLERWMILPFARDTFKTKSVTDRPGYWGKVFDKVYNELIIEGNIIILNLDPDDNKAYEKTNLVILDKAFQLNQELNNEKVTAIIVWEGKPKIKDDATEHFRKEAIKRNFKIEIINSRSN